MKFPFKNSALNLLQLHKIIKVISCECNSLRAVHIVQRKHRHVSRNGDSTETA
jgi:hypothetical protein